MREKVNMIISYNYRFVENAPKDILASEIKQLVWNLYKGVWDMYKKLLVERKKDFQSALKATNKMTLAELRRQQVPIRVETLSWSKNLGTAQNQGKGPCNCPPSPFLETSLTNVAICNTCL